MIILLVATQFVDNNDFAFEIQRFPTTVFNTNLIFDYNVTHLMIHEIEIPNMPY